MIYPTGRAARMGTPFPKLRRVHVLASRRRARKPLKRRCAWRGTPIAARWGGRLVESRAKQYVRCPPPGEGGPARACPRLIFGHPSCYISRVVAPDEFRRVLGHFATGVTIVTTRDADGRPTGLTVSAFCSVSLDPPQILVCVDHKSQSYPSLRDGGHFAVNFLGDGHEDISRRCSTARWRSWSAARCPGTSRAITPFSSAASRRLATARANRCSITAASTAAW